VSKRRLGGLIAALVAAAALLVGGGQLVSRWVLAPTEAVAFKLEAGLDPQAVANQIAGNDAVAYNASYCGGAAPSRQMLEAIRHTFYVDVSRGTEADALRRARLIVGVRDASLEPIPGPCSNSAA
jgi:hypothetical protein